MQYLKKLLFVSVFSFFFAAASAQDCGPITLDKLKELLTSLNYDPKPSSDTGKVKKWIVTNTGSSLNVPTAYEISPSTNYIWLTVNLGNAPTDSCEKNTALLRKNMDIQPCFFYITSKNLLMMALAVENRAVTSAVLKRCNDFIVKRVEETQDTWKQ